MNITFTIGNKYVTRDGRIVTCTGKGWGSTSFKDGNDDWLCVWEDSGNQFKDGRKSHNDIVSEYIEPQSVKFDWTKPAQTVGGESVVILGTNGKGRYPIYGYIGNDEVIRQWTPMGYYDINHGNRFNDLINVPEKKVVPLEPKDIKPSYRLRHVDEPEWCWRVIDGIKINKSGETIILISGSSIAFHQLCYWRISRDDGETWEKCEKEVIS